VHRHFTRSVTCFRTFGASHGGLPLAARVHRASVAGRKSATAKPFEGSPVWVSLGDEGLETWLLGGGNAGAADRQTDHELRAHARTLAVSRDASSVQFHERFD